MKIRLAIIDGDRQYLERLTAAFQNQFADQLEIYSFTTDETAYENFKQQRVDVIVMSDSFRVNRELVPKNCGFSYLTETSGIDTIEDESAICKYQKIDYIYKGILGLYAENAGAIGNHLGSNTVKVCSFFSITGGAGSSSLAAATALQMAKAGKRTLYLNMEQTGGSNLYFQAPGEGSFSDVIYMLKSKRINLALKIQSMVKQTTEGVYFFDDCTQAMDMLEITEDEFTKLIEVVETAGMFDVVIIDAGSYLTPVVFQAFGASAKVVCVSDGSEICQHKFEQMIEILEIKERQSEIPMIPRIAIAYNKFSNKTGVAVDMGKYPVLGGMPKYENMNTRQIIERLSNVVLLER